MIEERLVIYSKVNTRLITFLYFNSLGKVVQERLPHDIIENDG